MKHDVQAQFLKRRHPFAKAHDRGSDDATITSRLLAVFDEKWKDLNTRLDLVPGKDVLSRLNAHLQKNCGVTITPTLIIDAMTELDIVDEMKAVLQSLNSFSKGVVKGGI
jgi:hypothetical protein